MVYSSTAAGQFGSVGRDYLDEGREPSSRASTGQLSLVHSRTPSGSKIMRVLVGVQDEGFNGIETYAEQVALAGLAAGHQVTLLVTTDRVAESVRKRTEGAQLTVISLGLASPSKSVVLAQRLWPQLHTQRVGEALRKLMRSGSAFDVVHLNRPALAPWVEGEAQIFVAGWYYPHAPVERLTETWNHTQGHVARRVVLAAKSIAYYAGDAQGYRASTVVVACTETLAAQLRAQGHRAIACPPPVRMNQAGEQLTEPSDSGPVRLLLCCGDLSHPRKNLAHALRATGLFSESSSRRIIVRVIGANASALEAEAAALGASVSVEFLGTRSPEAVREEMQQAHALLLPSLYEEWGYVAVESILSGTPVVTYPVYPFADMLSGGLGVIAREVTPRSFAEAIERALHNVRGAALAQAGARRFGAATVGSRLTNIWSGLERGEESVFVAAPAFA
jgi:glycosyltransferase involved in cell wall biosynthesis